MKNRLLRRVLKAVALTVLLYFTVIFVHGWLSDWQPAEQPAALAPTQNSTQAVVADSVIQLLIWNVGYGGLGAESRLRVGRRIPGADGQDLSVEPGGRGRSGSRADREPGPPNPEVP